MMYYGNDLRLFLTVEKEDVWYDTDEDVPELENLYNDMYTMQKQPVGQKLVKNLATEKENPKSCCSATTFRVRCLI